MRNCLLNLFPAVVILVFLRFGHFDNTRVNYVALKQKIQNNLVHSYAKIHCALLDENVLYFRIIENDR